MTPRDRFTTIRRVSQFPPPYQQPPYSQQPYPPMDFSQYAPMGYGPDLLAPARRASILQGVLGTLTLGCGVLIGAIPYLLSVEDFIAQSGMAVPQAPPGWTLDQMMRLGFGFVGGCGAVIGVAMLALAFFVRGGGRGAILASMFFTGLVLLMLAIRVVAGLVQLPTRPVAAAVDLLIAAVLVGLYGLNMYWLAAAARSASGVQMAQQQYQAQFYQMQQQYAYGQGGQGSPHAQQGYGYPPPPPAAPQQQPSQQQPPPAEPPASS